MLASVTVECAPPHFCTHRMSTPASAAVETPYRTFMCVVCGFIYDEAAGWPADGIAPGTRWEDVPETWTCPDCGVTKSDFEMVEVSR